MGETEKKKSTKTKERLIQTQITFVYIIQVIICQGERETITNLVDARDFIILNFIYSILWLKWFENKVTDKIWFFSQTWTKIW